MLAIIEEIDDPMAVHIVCLYMKYVVSRHVWQMD